MSKRATWGLAMALLGGGPGCGGPGEAGEIASSVVSSVPATSASVAAPVAMVAISVDGAPVVTVASTEVTGRRALAAWLPEGARASDAWRTLEARSGARTLRLRDVAARYPDQDVALFPGPDGKLSLGVFRRETQDMPAWMKAKVAEPTVSLDAIETIDVRTRERVLDESPSVLALSLRGGASREVTEAELITLAQREKKPGGGDGQGGGRARKKQAAPLLAVVALSTPPAKIREIEAVGPKGRLTISGDELRSKGFDGSLRRNRRGEIVLRVGEARELRGVTSIEIVPAQPAR